jgi:hypothetical protein
MGCSCNGIEMSVVFVSPAQSWHKSSDPALQEATHLIVHNERLGLMRPVVDPQPWFAEFQDILHDLK